LNHSRFNFTNQKQEKESRTFSQPDPTVSPWSVQSVVKNIKLKILASSQMQMLHLLICLILRLRL
jgi:hypothetical protein